MNEIVDSFLPDPTGPAAEREARIDEALACAREVCPECDGRTTRWKRDVVGPNDAGNYVHEPKVWPHVGATAPLSLCAATSIHSRIRWLRDRWRVVEPEAGP